MNAGWQLDDFLEIVECLPQEIKSAFSKMTEKDKEFDSLNRLLIKQRQKALSEVATPTSKIFDKMRIDEKTATNVLDEKISICQNLIATLEAYMPILQTEIQKNQTGNQAILHQPSPVYQPQTNFNAIRRSATQSPQVKSSSPSHPGKPSTILK